MRAKKTLREAGLAFEVPRGAERAARLGSVLEVVYLIFNEGYAATAGEDLIRPALCAEAQRLGRILAGLVPDEPEVCGLLALMELQASRLAARTAPDGAPVPLPEQDRGALGPAADPAAASPRSARAEALGRRATGPTRCRRRSPPATPGRAGPRTPTGRGSPRSTTRCAEVTPSPVVELNRAVAHSMAFGPEAGLALLDADRAAPALARLRAAAGGARATCCSGPGRGGEARAEFERAAALSRNARERAFLLARAAACGA